jgi:predicted enzyme related to lactoylglutathione lyase
MQSFDNVISWFEIPAIDINRAARFYELVFDIQLIPVEMPDVKMRLFPLTDADKGIGGAIVESGGFHKPSMTDGPIIYLNANPDMNLILQRVSAAGGVILLPKTPISESYGCMSVFFDTEGNRIGLHSAS